MRALIIVGGLAAIGLVVSGALWLGAALNDGLKRRRQRRRRIEDYQDSASLEDLDRTRQRINRSIDQQ